MSKVENSTILIVNDAPDALELMSLQLHQAGYQILTATNGCEGFEIAYSQRPDMVISDVAMPKMNGIELCRMIRAEDGLHTIPILLVSAIHKEDAKVVEGLKAGADDYLEVPYNQLRLVAKVARLLERKCAEGALKFQAHLLNMVEQAVIATDLEGKINYWNRFAEKLYGWTASEAIGGNIIDLIPAQTTLEQASGIMSHLREGRSWSGEFLVRRKDGTTFPAIVTDSPIYDDQGALVGIIGVSIDITERKRAEETLREGEERYRTLFNSIDEGFCTIEVLFDGNDQPIDYRFLEVNPSFEKQTGIKDAQGRRMREIAPQHEEHWFEIYGKIALTGEPARFENLAAQLHHWYDVYAFRIGEPQERKVAILFKDITERKRAEESLHRANDELERRCEQRTQELTTANTSLRKEIAERKRAEEALKQSEQDYRGLFEQAHDAILVLAPEREIVLDVNKRACEIYGFSRSEFIGMSLETISKDIARGKAQVADTLERGDYLNFETVQYRKDGTEILLEINASTVCYQGQRAILSINRDITERKRIQEVLRESEERYRAFINQSSEAICRFELERPIQITLSEDEQIELCYRYVYLAECNMAMARMYGYSSPEEIVGARLGDLLIRSDPQNTEALRAAIRLGYQLADIESHEVDRDGNSKWFLNNFVGIIEDGFVIRLWGTQRDITAHKRAEEARRHAEEKYRSIFENAVDGIFQSTPDGRFLSVNPAMARMYGYDSPEEMIAERTDIERQHYVDPERRAEFKQRLEEQGGVVQGFESEVYRKDRSKFWTSESVRAVNDQKGALLYYEGFIEDITERVRAQEELKASEESYRRLVELSPDTIIVESEGKIDYVNPAGVKFFGATSPEQIVGLPALDFVHPDFKGLVKERMRQTRDGKKHELIEQKHVRLDGQIVNTEVAGIGIAYRGKRGSQAIIRDITERVRARDARMQLQLRLLTAQEEERHRLSRELHDQMGQHLPALMLGLKALKDSAGQNGPLAVDRLQQLQDLTERIARDTHALARDLRPVALDDFGLHTAISNYLEEWSERCGISVDFQSTGFGEDKRLSPHIEITLYRTVQEALTNVIKHAQAEHVSLILERSSQAVLAVVEDDGKGFNVEAVLGTPISERRLGLLGMQERVELVGGTLAIESAPGTGTTVVVRIPALTS